MIDNAMVLHIKALILKRLNYFKRDLRSVFCEILIPCLVIVFGLALMTISFVKTAPALCLNANNIFELPIYS